MNTLLELLGADRLVEYNKLVYPFNLPILKAALDSKLEEDPDYEVFVPATYFPLVSLLKKPEWSLVNSPTLLVSNKGRVIRRWAKGTVLTQAERFNSKGYRMASVTQGKVKNDVPLHRLMACSFLPISEELFDKHPRHLEVNHINGDKGDCILGNFEWVDRPGNIQHAYDTGLAKRLTGSDNVFTLAVKGTVLSGEHAGYEFIILGGQDAKLNGFVQSSISLCTRGKQKTHNNCSFCLATPEELEKLPKGMPKRT